MIVAVGVSNLQYVNLNSSRNLFIFGFALFFGLSFPFWMNNNSDVIDTGREGSRGTGKGGVRPLILTQDPGSEPYLC